MKPGVPPWFEKRHELLQIFLKTGTDLSKLNEISEIMAGKTDGEKEQIAANILYRLPSGEGLIPGINTKAINRYNLVRYCLDQHMELNKMNELFSPLVDKTEEEQEAACKIILQNLKSEAIQ